jgi:hypothetical protein
MKNRNGLTRRRLGKYLVASGAAALAASSPLLRGAEAKPSGARRALTRQQRDDLKKALADTKKTLEKLRAAELDESVAPAFAIQIPEGSRR